MLRPIHWLTLLAVLGAGCFGGEPADPVEEECEDAALCDLDQFLGDHYCVQNDLDRVYAPDVDAPGAPANPWQLGDWWEYAMTIGGVQQPTSKLIYYDIQDAGAHYMVGTPTREEALTHAVLSTNPVIGRVHKTLYSPHESGSHADMFHFPLCEGSSWVDTYFGTEFTFTASRADIPVPGGSDPGGFEIIGEAADGSRVKHTYSPDIKWFTMVDLDRADGFEVDMRLVDHGSNAAGAAYFLRGQQDETLRFEPTSSSAELRLDREEGSSGSYDSVGWHLDAERTSGDGRVELHIINPEGDSVACIGIEGNGIDGATECPEGPLLIETEWSSGTWTVRLQLPVVGTEASATATAASIYDRSGQI